MFASRLHRLVNNLCVVLPKRRSNQILNVFFTVILKKNVNNGLVIIIQFCHWLIIHDDETVISYFMPSHQKLKFLYNFKAKRFNVNLMNKNQPEPKHFGAFICDKMKKLNMMGKLPLHRNKWRDPKCHSGMTTVIEWAQKKENNLERKKLNYLHSSFINTQMVHFCNQIYGSYPIIMLWNVCFGAKTSKCGFIKWLEALFIHCP